MTPTRKQCLGAAIKANWWAVLIILALFTGLTYLGGNAADQQYENQRIAQVAE
jgi:hypothetical protein